MNNTKTFSIKDIASGIYDGPHATPPDSTDGPIFLSIDNVTDEGRLDLSEVKHISERDFPRWIKRVTPKKDDVVFSYEATLHKYAILPEGFHGCLGRRMALVRPNQEKVFPRFLHYYFLSRKWRSIIEANIISGATVNRIPIKKFPYFKVNIPALVSQKNIVDLVAPYDDLIDTNRRRIKLLEESARLLYREWFVYFKFPNHEKVKIVDSVPEGWKTSVVKDCISFISRGPSLDYISDGEDDGIPVLNQRCIRSGEIELDSVEYAKELSLRQQDLYLKEFDILINSMGEGTLGRVSRNLSIHYAMIIHNCITVVRVNENIINQTILFYRLSAAQTYLETMGLGSTGQTSLKKEVIERIKILIPPKELREQFDSIVKPIWLEVGSLKIQNQKLAQARDLLLPRLMSGAIEV